MVARTSPEAAKQTMLQAGLMPLTAYVDAKSPWPCRCTTCGHEYSATYDGAKQGRGCPSCANLARGKKAALARRLPKSTLDAIFKDLNFKLIGEYKSTHVPLNLLCLSCNKEISGTLRQGKKGDYSISCPNCSVQRKRNNLSPMRQELESLLQREGAKLLGAEPNVKSSKIRIKCRAGHEFSSTVARALERKTFCEQCTVGAALRTGASSRSTLDLEKLRDTLRNLGWTLLDRPKMISSEARVSCLLCAVESRSRLQRILSGSFLCKCRKDEIKREKLSSKLAPFLAENRGRIISAVPLRAKDYATFECEHGHQWTAIVQSICGGTWCPECAGNFMLTLSDIKNLAESRGGTLKSTEYLGVDANYSFVCNLGHEWDARFSKIKKGQWCPTCSKGSKSEEIARTTFQHLFKVPFKKVRPKWLRNSRGRIMEIDGYNDSLKIGFEYQGRQHFESIGIYGTDIVQRKADDQLKFELCSQNGVRLFYLTYQDSYEDFAKQIKDQAISFGIDISDLDFESEVDLSSAYVREDRLEELVSILEPKNIKVLSKKWLTANAKYSLECTVCGHKWKASGSAFFNSRKIAGCRICGYKSTAELNRGGLEDLRVYAAEHGGTCLSDSYVSRRWVYKWRCSKGDEFEGNFNNMKFRNQFCPICEGRTSRNLVTESEALTLFRRMKLELLEAYVGQRDLVKVRCFVCSVESKQSYSNLAEGMAPCSNCEHLRKSKEAVAVMLAAGVRPLEPYVNVTSKWLCECQTCHKQVTPTYSNVKRGGGPCIYCGRSKGAKKRLSKK